MKGLDDDCAARSKKLGSRLDERIDGFLAGLPYDELVPAIQKTNTTIDVPIADLGFTSEAP